MKLQVKRFVWLLVVFLHSCLPKDKAVELPPPGNLQRVSIELGKDYDKRVYFKFSNAVQHSISTYSYDLAFETGTSGWRIQLNTAQGMFVHPTTSDEPILLTTIRKLPLIEWVTDNSNQNLDSTALGNWKKTSNWYILDRGLGQFPNPTDRFYRLRILSVNETEYQIQYGKLPDVDTSLKTIYIPKRNQYTFTYFSFDKGVVDIAPPTREWDIVFTKYMTIMTSETLGSPFYNYSVTGVLGNLPAGIQMLKMRDSLPYSYIPFDEITVEKVQNLPFGSQGGDAIGWDWKLFDFDKGYTIQPNRAFLIKDSQGFIYKMRFTDFYGPGGEKGMPQFQYQRL